MDKHREFDYAIFGGEDHKTGQIKNTAEAYERLKRTFLQLIALVTVPVSPRPEVLSGPAEKPLGKINLNSQR